MNWFNDISLINGAVPSLSWILAAAAGIILMARRSRRWWLFSVLVAVAATGIAILACWAVIHVFYWWAEDLPPMVVALVAFLIWALTLTLTTAVGGLRRRRRGRGAAGSSDGKAISRSRHFAVIGAMVLAAVSVAVQLNAVFGQYPTLASLVTPPAAIAVADPPAVLQGADARFMDTAVTQRWNPPAGLPLTGTVFSTPIPGTVSGFKARNALVYLPPAYSAANRPVLPVLVLVSGQPGSPESWLRSTRLINDLDVYAAAHNGLAPIVVMPDPNGADSNNTMCMNSALGQADSYMAQDVPAWIKTHLDADTNPEHWAVGGFSYGGTCAVQMVTRHPDQFHAFLAISPELEPALAAKRSITVDKAFKGDTAAFDAQVPLTLFANHKYQGLRGWFASGSDDELYSANVVTLRAAADKAGMTTDSAKYAGGHSWAVASAALPAGFKFIFAGMGLA